jgi:hypothetical protein
MRPLRWALAVLLAAGAALVLLGPHAVNAQQILQYGFEARGPVWKPGSTDAAGSEVLQHELTDEHAHSGQRSEHIRIKVGKGSYLYYTYPIPRAPVTEDLKVGLYLQSNRPGIQLLCRIVLPREKDPKNPTQPLTITVRCEPYQYTRWKLITLKQPVKRLREQQQLLAHQENRDIVTTGAYIDQLILNLYDGPGLTDVWIDDLEVGPVLDSQPTTQVEPTQPALPASRQAAEVVLRGNQLVVSGKPFLLRAIRHTGTPLKILREAGFNTIFLDETTPAAMIEDAVASGFWIVPSLRPPAGLALSPVSVSPGQGTGQVSIPLNGGDQFAEKVSRFASRDAVLAWDLGSNLEAESFTEVMRFARAFRAADQQQPVMADVWDGYRGYSRSLEQVMLGTHRWPLMTSMELGTYREWLVQRRRLSMDNYSWTWIQTHMPDWFANLVYEGGGKNGFSEPVGPQPEQIRLLAYLALAAGYRGLAFWSDRYLADSHQGRDRLLSMALLNQELQMLERVLVQATRPPEWIDTSNGEAKAAVFRTREGVLVLPIWVGKNSQFVPGQGASAELSITVPGVPITATAWEISPGRMQSYPIKRELGGTTVKLHNFSLTSAVLFTSDLSPTGLIVRLQDQQRRVGRLAAQWLHDQAKEELAKVEKVQADLERLGHSLPDASALLEKARKSLDRCVQHRRNGEHTEAYSQAEVALRSLRVLMRAHWDKAVRDLDTPVSSPYAVSFFTLPRHWQLLDQLHRLKATPTILRDGGFETDPKAVQAGWIVRESPSLDAVKVTVRRVVGTAHSGKQSLLMQVAPRDPKHVPVVLERTFVSLQSPEVRLPPGTLVRVSAWINIPGPIRGATDGVEFYDSACGEPLAVRLTEPTKWKRYSLFRRVPASGTMNVTMAMSGLGTVYFDDIRIEPLTPGGSTASAPQPTVRGTRP